MVTVSDDPAMPDEAPPSGASAAEDALGLHVDDGAGNCQGCKAEFEFLVTHPCTVRQSAIRTRIIESTPR